MVSFDLNGILKYLCSFFLLLLSPVASAQYHSEYAYIYKITDKEAAEIVKDENRFERSYLHTKVDSVAFDSVFPVDKLPLGYYLQVCVCGDFLDVKFFDLKDKADFVPFILNNSNDLCVQIYGKNGEVLRDAELAVNGRKLKFDDKQNCYIRRRCNDDGLLSVERNGNCYFFLIDKYRNSNRLLQGGRFLLMKKPLSYISNPIANLVSGVRNSIRYGEFYPLKSAASMNNRILMDYITLGAYSRKKYDGWSGYMVSNKPMYRPGDTVRVKAYVVNSKGKPVTSPANVTFCGKRVADISPYSPGCYVYDLPLSDSLNLKLNKNYCIKFESREDEDYSWNRKQVSLYFAYKDYELKNKYKLRLQTADCMQYKGSLHRFWLDVKDENELRVKDGKVKVFVLPQSVEECFEKKTVVPDTLIAFNLPLFADSETIFDVPDSIFPNANVTYKVKAEVTTSDGMFLHSYSESVSYVHLRETINFEYKDDSLFVSFAENGTSQPKDIVLREHSAFGTDSVVYHGKTPCAVRVTNLVSYYEVLDVGGKRLSSYPLTYHKATLEPQVIVKDGCMEVSMKNPHKLPFVYDLYKGNNRLAAGHGISFHHKVKFSDKYDYLLSVRYVFGGYERTHNFLLNPVEQKEELLLDVSQPRQVYPGEKCSVDVFVTDTEGNPVCGADVTAYGNKEKLCAELPELSDYFKCRQTGRKGKSLFNKFFFPEGRGNERQSLLPSDFDVFFKEWGLDTIAYYRFIRPKEEIEKLLIDVQDSSAAFVPVVLDGDADRRLINHIVYVDGAPVYYLWSAGNVGCMIHVTPGFHDVAIRTNEEKITIDSLYFEKGKGSFFCLNVDKVKSKNVKMEKMPKSFTEEELQLFENTTAHLVMGRNDGVVCLYNDGGASFVLRENGVVSDCHVGPLGGRMELVVDGECLDTIVVKSKGEIQNKQKWLSFSKPDSLMLRRRVSCPLLRYPNHSELSDYSSLLFVMTKEWMRRNSNKMAKSVDLLSWTGFCQIGKLRIVVDGSPDSLKQKPVALLVTDYDRNKTSFVSQYELNSMSRSLGCFRLALLTGDLNYYMLDSLSVNRDSTVVLRLDSSDLKCDKDSLFRLYKEDDIQNRLIDIIALNNPADLETVDGSVWMSGTFGEQIGKLANAVGGFVWVSGIISDDEGGIPGVNVVIKGTEFGAATDWDGHFSLAAPIGSILQISSVGYKTEEFKVSNARSLRVKMKTDDKALDEVVVIGYGVQKKGLVLAPSLQNYDLPENSEYSDSQLFLGLFHKDSLPLIVMDGTLYVGDVFDVDTTLIASFELKNDVSLKYLYGERAKNGVLYIWTVKLPSVAQKEDTNTVSIRSRFSDCAFWQPTLKTDKAGHAKFEITFPDDVTKWSTFYIATDGPRFGTKVSEVRSFKQVMSQLYAPRFVIEGDTAFVVGKTRNYSSDTLVVNPCFLLDSTKTYLPVDTCADASVYEFPISAKEDTMSVGYVTTLDFGYSDGERLQIPVFPRGVESVSGHFFSLDRDTTLSVSLDSSSVLTISAFGGVEDVVRKEMSSLLAYKHLCNEQLGSKLKSLLCQQIMDCSINGRPFGLKKDVVKIIDLLQDRVNKEGLWGWWSNGETEVWISLHVLESLSMAQRLGYEVDGEKLNKVSSVLAANLREDKNVAVGDLIMNLAYLNKTQKSFDCSPYLMILDSMQISSFERLRLELLKAECSKITPNLDVFRHETALGNVYYGNNDKGNSIYVNDLQSSVLVYEYLRSDSAGNHSEELRRIRNYFMETRLADGWRNTYQSARVIEAIYEDLISEKIESPKLRISGDVDTTVTMFPFEMKVNHARNLRIEKIGLVPVYLSLCNRSWKKDDTKMDNDVFRISSHFETDTLHVGEEVSLYVDVVVDKYSTYVMINVPIPAGCSYKEMSRNRLFGESNREYFKNEVSICCKEMKEGTYRFEVKLLPRYKGVYSLNPATVELMYFPNVRAVESMKTVRID